MSTRYPPVVVPACCFADPSHHGPADGHGLEVLCAKCHAELPPPSDPSDVVREIRRSTGWRMFWRRIKRGLGL